MNSELLNESQMQGTRHLGQRIFHYRVTDSTNNRARAFARDRVHSGVIIRADQQTAGRGQYGRVWQSAPGSAILMSALLFPPPLLRRPAILTAWVGVAVAETIRQITGLQAKLKWPNDVLILGKKVCGILIESGVVAPASADGSPGDYHVIVGIGLNINQTTTDFAEAQLPDATSLGIQTGAKIDVDSLFEHLVRMLDEDYARLLEGDIPTLEACWKWRVGLLGKPVCIELMDGREHHGRLREMAFDGVILEQQDQLQTWMPEEIRHVKAL